MTTHLSENNYKVDTEQAAKKKKTTHAIDIVLWSLWAVLMWGFLFLISVISSPSNKPGIHELIITGYFLGFSVVFAVIYIMVLKRG